MSLKSTILKGSGWLSLSSLVTTILRVISIAILARLLTPMDFGIYAAAFLIIGFAKLFYQVGVGPVFIQLKSINSAHVQTGFSISLLLGLGVGIFSFLTADFLSIVLNVPETADIIRIFSFIFPINSIGVISINLLERELKFSLLSIIESISYVIGSFVLSILLAILDFGYWSLVWGYVCSVLLKNFAAFYYAPTKLKFGFSRREFREMLPMGIWFSLAKVMSYVSLQADYFIASRYLGAISLGIYSRAYRIMDIFNSLFGTTLDRVFFPVLSRIQEDLKKMASITEVYINLSFLFLMPIFIAFSLFSPEIVNIMLGSDWVSVVEPLEILLIAAFFKISYKYYASINKSLGKIFSLNVFQAIYAILILGLALYLKDIYGLNGIAYAVLLSILIMYSLQAISAFKLMKIEIRKIIYLHIKGLSVNLVFFSLCLLSRHYLHYHTDNDLIIVLFLLILISLYMLIIIFLPNKFTNNISVDLKKIIFNKIRNN